jgi:hypothetical protein
MTFIARTLVLLLSLGLSGMAMAQSVTINAGNAPYSSLPILNGTGIGSNVEVREAALSQAAGMYRSQFGIMAMSKLKVGERFRMKYQDGTSETAVVVTQTSSFGSVPVPGTQRDADGNLVSGTGGGGSNGGGGSSGGIWGITGYRPIYRTGTVCSGGVCQTTTILVGYEPVYGYIQP